MSPPLKKTVTPETYLESEIASEVRNEYRNGEIISMAGGTPQHNRISGNLYIALTLALRKQPYETFHNDQRLWIPEKNIYTYPDVMVTSKPLTLQEGRKDTVLNPCFIAEVLSQSTQGYDRGEKFLAYRTIDTLKEYILIDQYQPFVEHYHQTAVKHWSLIEYTELTEVIQFQTFNYQLSLADIYEEIEF